MDFKRKNRLKNYRGTGLQYLMVCNAGCYTK